MQGVVLPQLLPLSYMPSISQPLKTTARSCIRIDLARWISPSSLFRREDVLSLTPGLHGTGSWNWLCLYVFQDPRRLYHFDGSSLCRNIKITIQNIKNPIHTHTHKYLDVTLCSLCISLTEQFSYHVTFVFHLGTDAIRPLPVEFPFIYTLFHPHTKD